MFWAFYFVWRHTYKVKFSSTVLLSMTAHKLRVAVIKYISMARNFVLINLHWLLSFIP